MKHPEMPVRKYNKPDDEMLQQSNVQQALFVENKDKFTGSFPQLADPYAEEWAALNTAAKKVLPDYASLANQTSQTTTVEEKMKQGRSLYQTLILYTQLAYPGNATILKLMGQPQYDASRNSQLKLPTLMHTAFAQASKPECKAALIAKGMKDADIDALDSLAESISDQDELQEKSKKDRSYDSGHRITTLNNVWDKMALVCQCAKLVFQDDATLFEQFLLDEGSSDASAPIDTPIPPVG